MFVVSIHKRRCDPKGLGFLPLPLPLQVALQKNCESLLTEVTRLKREVTRLESSKKGAKMDLLSAAPLPKTKKTFGDLVTTNEDDDEEGEDAPMPSRWPPTRPSPEPEPYPEGEGEGEEGGEGDDGFEFGSGQDKDDVNLDDIFKDKAPIGAQKRESHIMTPGMGGLPAVARQPTQKRSSMWSAANPALALFSGRDMMPPPPPPSVRPSESGMELLDFRKGAGAATTGASGGGSPPLSPPLAPGPPPPPPPGLMPARLPPGGLGRPMMKALPARVRSPNRNRGAGKKALSPGGTLGEEDEGEEGGGATHNPMNVDL
jgi:hypothetical protein